MQNDYNGGRWQPSPAAPYSYDYYAQREAESALLRRHANGVGLCIIVYFALQYVFTLFLMVSSGLTLYQNNVAFFHAVNAVYFSLLSLFVPFLVFSLRRGSPSYIEVLPLSAPKNKRIAVLVLLGAFGVCMISNYVAGFISELIQSAGLVETDTTPRLSADALSFALNVLSTAAMPALTEEFVFRGVIMQPLRRYGEHFAVFSSAFLFALAHGTVTGFTFAFLVGLALGYTAVLTGSLWPGVIVHFLNNFYAVVVTDLDSIAPHAANLLSSIVVYGGLFLGVGSIVFLIMSHSIHFQKSRLKDLMKGKRFKSFFLSVPMLIAIAMFVVTIFVLNLK